MRGFGIKGRLGPESYFEFSFPLKFAVFVIRNSGSYLRVFGMEWKLKGRGGSSPLEKITLILFNLRNNPFVLRSINVKVRGGFYDPFYSGLFFGLASAVSPFFILENLISFEKIPFSLEIEGKVGVRVLKVLKILYNSLKRRRLWTRR